jgi:hypothetical protein
VVGPSIEDLEIIAMLINLHYLRIRGNYMTGNLFSVDQSFFHVNLLPMCELECGRE